MSNYNPPCLWVHMDYDEADFSSRFAGNPDSVHPLETRAEIGLSRFWPTVQADASSGAMILHANEQMDCADTDKPARWPSTWTSRNRQTGNDAASPRDGRLEMKGGAQASSSALIGLKHGIGFLLGLSYSKKGDTQ